MRQDQRFDGRFLRDSTDVLRRGVIGPDMRHDSLEGNGPAFGDLAFDVFFHRRHVHDLMHEHVGVPRHYRHSLQRRADSLIFASDTVQAGPALHPTFTMRRVWQRMSLEVAPSDIAQAMDAP